MILTETGHHFRREPDGWRCVEYPELVMLPGGDYRVAGVVFGTLAAALKVAREGLPLVPTCPPLTRVYRLDKYHD